MSTLLLLTSTTQPSAEVLPALALLSHQVRILPAEGSALLEAPDADVVLVDGRKELGHARDLCRLMRTTGTDSPVLLIVTEGGLAVVTADWGMDEVVLWTLGPAELEARLRLAIGRLAAQRDADDPEAHVIPSGEGSVDDSSYTAKSGGPPLALHVEARWPAARPDVQGVRAAEVPRPAPGPRLHPRAAAAGGVGLRLLRRHPHGRRSRPAATGQARPRARGADRHRVQRRIPVRAGQRRPG